YYRRTGGGKLPWLFFGIKSYRLYAWHHNHQPKKAASFGIKCVRVAWRYYTYAPVMAIILIVLSFTPAKLSSISRYCLLIIAVSITIGMIAIAAEGTLAAFILQSWAVLILLAMAGPKLWK